jgi:hypothetical protein
MQNASTWTTARGRLVLFGVVRAPEELARRHEREAHADRVDDDPLGPDQVSRLEDDRARFVGRRLKLGRRARVDQRPRVLPPVKFRPRAGHKVREPNLVLGAAGRGFDGHAFLVGRERDEFPVPGFPRGSLVLQSLLLLERRRRTCVQRDEARAVGIPRGAPAQGRARPRRRPAEGGADIAA